MFMSSKVAYGTYSYSVNPARGDIGTASFNGTSITAHAGVVTTYNSGAANIGPDPKPFYFKNSAGADRVLVASLSWSGGVANTHYLIYQANADNTSPYTWGSPVYGPQTWTVGSTAITNPYKFVTKTVGGVCYIYGIDYDNKTVFRISSSGDTYTLDTAHSFTFTPPTGKSSYGVDLQIVGDYVYALFISGTNLMGTSASYVKSTLVRLNTSLASPTYKGPHGSTTTPGSGEIWPAENAFSIQAYGSYLYLVAVGGMQHYTTPITWNPESRLQRIAISNLTVTDVLRAATTAEASTKQNDCFDFRALTFSSDGSQAFILTGAYNASYTMSWRLYVTDMDTLASTSNALVSSLVATKDVRDVANASTLGGYLWALLFSESTQKTWFARGNDLAIYSSSGIVGSAAGIATLSSLGAGNSPSLNAVTLYGGEVAPTAKTLKGYAAPAFASNSAQALIERKKLLELMNKNKK